MPFFKKERSGKSLGDGAVKGKGKKTSEKYGAQHHLLGNAADSGAMKSTPITKKACGLK